MIEAEPYLLIIACLAFSAFFSGIEIAFVSSDKLRLELITQKGGLVGRILGHFQEHRSHFLATTLVGNNLALVLYGVLMAQLIDPWLTAALPSMLRDPIIVLLVQSLISTFIVLVTAEFLPKSIFMIDPDFMLRLLAIPMVIIYFIMYPVVVVVAAISKYVITRVLRSDYSEEKPVYGLTDLNNYIKKNSKDTDDEVHEIDPKIFNNALEFKEVKVRECMIPRTEIIAVDVDDEVDELKKAFIESGHSKIVVYKESIDDVIGYCHSLEMFKKPTTIKKILTPIIIVPETTPANELLIQFINEHKSLALVVDEFGGTSGIASMEDVMEEIFGEIRDEHDEEYFKEEPIGENEFLFSARLEVDYLNDKYDLELPDGEYDTLGGFILHINEDIPNIGDEIKHEQFDFTIMTMEENRIDVVKLKVLAETQ